MLQVSVLLHKRPSLAMHNVRTTNHMATMISLEESRNSVTLDLYSPDDFIDWKRIEERIQQLRPAVDALQSAIPAHQSGSKKKLIEVIKNPAQHLAIRAMQDLFHTNEHRLYHWVQDRRVPPDNNLAERDLRPTVIARKVSFGSSSDAGSKTRSILMSVLHTLNKRREDQSLESIFKNLLDQIAKNPIVQIAFLFPLPKSIPRN